MAIQDKALIKSIIIDKLFGYLSYKIKARSREDPIILYGDNGSGKTTILNLIFHTISPKDKEGHRTIIADIPFKRFEITFFDGHSVSVTRTKASKGPFTMQIKQSERELASHKFTLNPEGIVRSQNESTYLPFLKSLAGLNLGLFWLPDNRKILSNLYEDETRLKQKITWGPEDLLIEETEPETIDILVQKALNRASNWTRRQALTAASQGETDTTKIYAEILRRIAGPTSMDKSTDHSMTFSELSKKAIALQDRSNSFRRLGLVAPIKFKDFIPVLKSASRDKQEVIRQVLSPYINSVEARLNALEELREALNTFSEIFKRFYNYKTLNFDVRRGIYINLQYSAEIITPEILSSGEKQLLLLFCNVLLARSRPSIFIIDEPELSLNIKWQRELISSLMSCVKGCDVQFIFATHSLEMISLHKASAIKLIIKR